MAAEQVISRSTAIGAGGRSDLIRVIERAGSTVGRDGSVDRCVLCRSEHFASILQPMGREWLYKCHGCKVFMNATSLQARLDSSDRPESVRRVVIHAVLEHHLASWPQIDAWVWVACIIGADAITAEFLINSETLARRATKPGKLSERIPRVERAFRRLMGKGFITAHLNGSGRFTYKLAVPGGLNAGSIGGRDG